MNGHVSFHFPRLSFIQFILTLLRLYERMFDGLIRRETASIYGHLHR